MKFIVVLFFCDILFYRKTWYDRLHCWHLTIQLEQLHNLVLNFKKCNIGKNKID